MTQEHRKLLILASFEDASILRKFTILFLISSIIPMVLLYYVYFLNEQQRLSDVTTVNLGSVMILMALGVLVGYASIRALLVKVIDISKANRKGMEKFLSHQTIEEIDHGENELVVLSRSFSAITDKLEESVRNLKATQETLHFVMSKVGQGVYSKDNIANFLQLIVETMTKALNGQVGMLLIFNDDKSGLILQHVYGLAQDNQDPSCIKITESPKIADILKQKQPAVILGDSLFDGMAGPEAGGLLKGELLCVPLVYGDLVSGMIILTRDKDTMRTFSIEDVALLSNVASQTAVAIENSKLSRDIEKTYFQTISALAMTVDAKDKYSRGHLDRVADYSLLIGKCLGLSEKDLNTLRDAAQLHDLGKIGIPDDILRKEGKLTEEEWQFMYRHTEIGENIIKPVSSLGHLCDLIRHHHEKLDGTGYPDGLKDKEISLLVRILTIADIYDALTTERPYRPKRTKEEAAQILRSMNHQLDQNIVEIFLKEIDKR